MAGDGGRAKPTKARFALASNVRHLMDNYSKGFEVGLNPPELEKGCGVSAKTIRRIIDPYSDHTPNLDNIDRLAEFFGVATWELLRPRPPVLHAEDVAVAPTPAKPPNSRGKR